MAVSAGGREKAAGRHLPCASTAARSRRRAAHRHSRGTGCLVTAASWLRCASPMSRRMRDPLRRRGLRGVPAARRLDRRARARIPALAIQHRDRLPGGRVPQSGEKFVQSDLARTLQFMADQDPCRRWRPRGRAARARRTVTPSTAAISRARSSASSSRRRLSGDGRPCGMHSRIEPGVVRRAWRGYEVITCSPWCQGRAARGARAAGAGRRRRAGA